jgi:hypothetical protein
VVLKSFTLLVPTSEYALVIHSSRVNRGSHLACTAGPANSCISRMPPVCSWYIWPILESPAEMAITTFISVSKSPP